MINHNPFFIFDPNRLKIIIIIIIKIILLLQIINTINEPIYIIINLNNCLYLNYKLERY